MVASLDMPAASEAITQMQAKQACIREALNHGLQQLLDVHNGLNALTSLLARAEGQQLTCHDLACLIEPQQHKLMRGIEQAFQVL